MTRWNKQFRRRRELNPLTHPETLQLFRISDLIFAYDIKDKFSTSRGRRFSIYTLLREETKRKKKEEGRRGWERGSVGDFGREHSIQRKGEGGYPNHLKIIN